jgi:O-acetyl-ADP-ribose deacetylase (regulator of RNase III)
MKGFIMQIVHQDILTVKNAIICHQVNHEGIMGAGLALQIKKKYPGIMMGYINHCRLYSFEILKKNGIVNFYYPNHDLIYGINKEYSINNIVIANIFGQKEIGGGLQTDYEALKNGMLAVFHKAMSHKYIKDIHHNYPSDISIPYKIGCGLAGGDWNIVKNEIIQPLIREFPQIKTTIYYKFEDDLEEEDK